MANVTIHENKTAKPQEQPQNIIVTDSTGRKIALKKPNVIQQYRLVASLKELAEVRTYFVMCLPLIYVQSIDGDLVVEPRTHREIEALITRLDEHGLMAVQAGIEKHFNKSPQDEIESAKK